MSNSLKKSILLIGYDSNIGLGVVYCFHKDNYNIYVLTNNKKNALKHSVFVKKVFYYEEEDNATPTIINIVNQYKIDLIMPYDEHEIRMVTKDKEILNQYAPCMWGTNPDSFNMAINKRSLSEFLKQNNIPCPDFAALDDLEKVENIISEYGFPLLIKPVRGFGGKKISKIFDRQALNSFFNSNQSREDYVLQPFIIGTDVTCNVICKEGEVLCYTIQESPVKDGSNFNSNDILWFHEDELALSIIRKLMKGLNCHGVACVDMRRNIKDGSINVLEINGRFWASVVPSYVKAGINFPLILLKLSLNEEVHIPRLRKANQISLKQYLKNKFRFKKVSLRNTKYLSYFSDPKARLMQILIK